MNILMDAPFHIDLCTYMDSPDREWYLLPCPDENHVEFVKCYFPQVKIGAKGRSRDFKASRSGSAQSSHGKAVGLE